MSYSVVMFGPFEVNGRSGELRNRGVPVALQEQPFRVLMELLRRPGEVVSRVELCRRLWPEGTYVDFEHGLNAAVRRLRVALDDDNGCFVETVPRRGYRFVVPVRPQPIADPSTRLRLAVLPFLSPGDGMQKQFSDGLTEEATVQIACRCPRNVKVVAHTTARVLSRSGKSTSDLVDALRADFLLEGSVRAAGNRVRIVTKLIDAHAETHLWAESYERELGDAFEVQVDVAGRIAHAVVDALSPAMSSAISH